MWIVYRLDVILFSSFRFVFLCYTIELWRNREKRKTDFLSFFLFWFDAKKKGKLIEVNINYKVSFFNSLLQCWTVYRLDAILFPSFRSICLRCIRGIMEESRRKVSGSGFTPRIYNDSFLLLLEYTRFVLLISRANFSPDVSLSQHETETIDKILLFPLSLSPSTNFALRNTPFVSTWSTNFVLSTRSKRSIQFYYAH